MGRRARLSKSEELKHDSRQPGAELGLRSSSSRRACLSSNAHRRLPPSTTFAGAHAAGDALEFGEAAVHGCLPALKAGAHARAAPCALTAHAKFPDFGRTSVSRCQDEVARTKKPRLSRDVPRLPDEVAHAKTIHCCLAMSERGRARDSARAQKQKKPLTRRRKSHLDPRRNRDRCASSRDATP